MTGNEPNINSTTGLQNAGTVLSQIQKYNTQGIYVSDSDKTFATYELSELKYLPKSLFYDAATSDGVYRGLFAYYVLGKGNSVEYQKSELKTAVSKITPQVSRNPTAKQIIDEVTGELLIQII